jgi:hypothetical protein
LRRSLIEYGSASSSGKHRLASIGAVPTTMLAGGTTPRFRRNSLHGPA